MKWSVMIVATLAALLAAFGAAFALSPPVEPEPKPKVEVIFAEPSVKAVRITLAPGATLPAHTTPVHATVAAMSGAGYVTIADKRHELGTHHAVFLPKAIPHAVVNTGKAPLVLLVHHLLTTK